MLFRVAATLLLAIAAALHLRVIGYGADQDLAWTQYAAWLCVASAMVAFYLARGLIEPAGRARPPRPIGPAIARELRAQGMWLLIVLVLLTLLVHVPAVLDGAVHPRRFRRGMQLCLFACAAFAVLSLRAHLASTGPAEPGGGRFERFLRALQLFVGLALGGGGILLLAHAIGGGASSDSVARAAYWFVLAAGTMLFVIGALVCLAWHRARSRAARDPRGR